MSPLYRRNSSEGGTYHFVVEVLFVLLITVIKCTKIRIMIMVFADIQNKKECGGNRQWQNHYLRNWAANTKGKGII